MADTNTPPPADKKEDVVLDENGQVDDVRTCMPLPRGPVPVPRCFVCAGHDSERRARHSVLPAAARSKRRWLRIREPRKDRGSVAGRRHVGSLGGAALVVAESGVCRLYAAHAL